MLAHGGVPENWWRHIGVSQGIYLHIDLFMGWATRLGPKVRPKFRRIWEKKLAHLKYGSSLSLNIQDPSLVLSDLF